MDKETYGALKRIIAEVKEKRKYNCLMKDCVCNDIIGGNDIALVEKWIEEEKGWKDCENCRKCGENTCGNDTEFYRCFESI
jgi:hypothetical protein